jgi:hypothetical protein
VANPRSLIYALYTHWDILESLIPLSREFPVFEQQQLLNVIARIQPEKNLEEREDLLRQLASSDLLQILPRDSALQIHPLVLEFVRGLTREHELGLSEILRARVEAIKNATSKLSDGLLKNNTDQLRQAASQLAELFRQISQQLDQDRHAILEIAERAKSADANLPIAQRYREVLEAYDNYIAPMAEMMDSGPSGTFYRHLEAAEHTLDHIVDTLTIQGSLYSQRLAMRQVAFQAKELRRLGRDVLKHCSATLLPLREEIRQHNELSSAISQLLSKIRKRGLNWTLRSNDLPLWRRVLQRRVSVGNEVLTIMGEGMNYKPATVDFPEDIGVEDTPIMELIDEADLLKRLQSDIPINNLLYWLHQQYPQSSDTNLLRIYHEIINRREWQITQADFPNHQNLNTVRVTHYPHAIEMVTEEQ